MGLVSSADRAPAGSTASRTPEPRSATSSTSRARIANSVGHGLSGADAHRPDAERISASDDHGTVAQLAQAGSSLGNIVPTVFTWSHGGSSVFVTGAWDHWQSKAPMHRTGNEYSVILSLQVGHFQYKFIVDGEWRHCGSQATERDEDGNINNVVVVKPRISEFDLPEANPDDRPLSPSESYNFSMPNPEEYAIEPPQLPPHYQAVILNSSGASSARQLNHQPTAVVSSPASGAELAFSANLGERASDPTKCDVPQHVSIKHLYTAVKQYPEEEISVVGVSKRYKSKYVTTLMYVCGKARHEDNY